MYKMYVAPGGGWSHQVSYVLLLLGFDVLWFLLGGVFAIRWLVSRRPIGAASQVFLFVSVVVNNRAGVFVVSCPLHLLRWALVF